MHDCTNTLPAACKRRGGGDLGRCGSPSSRDAWEMLDTADPFIAVMSLASVRVGRVGSQLPLLRRAFILNGGLGVGRPAKREGTMSILGYASEATSDRRT